MTTINDIKKHQNTKQAKAEHQYGRDERAKDVIKVAGAALAEQQRLAAGGINFALFNFIMSTTSFKECKPGTMEPMHLLYRNLMVHMNRVSREAAEMAKELGRDFIDPTAMATEKLEEIAKLAKSRAKINQYNRKNKNLKILS